MINYAIPCPILTLDFLDRDKQEVRARLVLVVVFGSNFVPLFFLIQGCCRTRG